MEEINKNNESDKTAGSTSKPQVIKPAAAGPVITTPSGSTAKSPAKPLVQSPEKNTSTGPARPTTENPVDTITPAPEKAPGTSTPVPGKKSKKLAKAFKKLKAQKRGITTLEKNRDRLMKDLISAIENKKKGNKIRNLARDFNRIEQKVKTRTASYLRAKKKLAKKMK